MYISDTLFSCKVQYKNSTYWAHAHHMTIDCIRRFILRHKSRNPEGITVELCKE